jgi:hypothetical protein
MLGSEPPALSGTAAAQDERGLLVQYEGRVCAHREAASAVPGPASAADSAVWASPSDVQAMAFSATFVSSSAADAHQVFEGFDAVFRCQAATQVPTWAGRVSVIGGLGDEAVVLRAKPTPIGDREFVLVRRTATVIILLFKDGGGLSGPSEMAIAESVVSRS